MKVLDLDMDYFMTEVVTDISPSSVERLSDEDYGSSVWPAERVVQFLEKNLGLKKDHKIPGRIVPNHDEALLFWEELLKNGNLSDPFDVVHVDSHADLGLDCHSIGFLLGPILSHPVPTRRLVRNFEFNDKIEGICSGDYLLWAAAYRMISSITYCQSPYSDVKQDYPLEILKDFCEKDIYDKPVRNVIQLTYNKDMEIPTFDVFMYERCVKKYLGGAIKDPEIEFLIIPTIEDVRFHGDFDFAVLAQSPNYTPEKSDFIMEIFRDYIKEI